MPDNQTQPVTEKVVFEFQHTDEQGNPIIDPRTGKQAFTNLTGANYQEIAEKLKDSYLNSARALARAKNHKPVPKEAELQPKQLNAEEERQAAVDLQDPSKARAAVRKLTGVDDLEAEMKKTKEIQLQAKIAMAQASFVLRHHADYYACAANSVELKKYILENELDPTSLDNYEVAFNAVGHLLAQRPTPSQATPPANEPPPPVRPSSGGIVPGEATGTRPPKRPKNEITKESIREMQKTPEGRAEFKKRMRDQDFINAVNALGIRPSGNF